ncbi:LPD7 domain-containing protein [Asticcacaulis sp. W401b]|uniref:LPD7 domain-containing protein n=1 Tax=Asticcacaulis sp. W401b TaxID=3388666 RepID=UPI003971035B
MNEVESARAPDKAQAADKALAAADWYYDWSDDASARQRGYESYRRAMDTLESLAQSDQTKARDLWTKHAPKETTLPEFLVEGYTRRPDERMADDERSELAGATRQPLETPQRLSTADPVPEAVRNRFLQVGKAFHYRDKAGVVAFQDKQKSLVTAHDDVHVVRAMIDVAQTRGWTSIRVRGSEKFKREAWLQASVRGIEIEGLRPNDVDRAKLNDLRRHEGSKSRGPVERGVGDAEQPLSRQQETAVEALKAILKDRGDSEIAVEMAADIARQRFRTSRTYVGQVKEIGDAPYQDNPDNTHSPYVTLTTRSGDQKIWGVDLPRALGEGWIQVGDEIALAYQGRKRVEVTVRSKDAEGRDTSRKELVDRNSWDARRLDDLQNEVKARLTRAANVEPIIQVYDRQARSNKKANDRVRQSHRSVERTR